MDENINKILKDYIIEEADGKFKIDDSIYTDKEFHKKLENDVSHDEYASYCLVCNFINREPARGMLFNSKKKLVDYFISALVSQNVKQSNNFYIYAIIIIIFVIFVSLVIGYNLKHLNNVYIS